ncbi:hypothetical protein BDF14DRAFT_893439 [Spinellus fusiger]|nr:hypothetical protein BDF14DRAFT_893439 [Spinellus fusiger]
MHRIKEADKTRPTSEPPKPKRNTFGSKPSFSSLPPQSSTLRSLQEVDPKPRPSSSVSTQLRQRTQKFTCAFSSVVHSNPTLANKPRNARSHEEFIVQDTHLPLHTLSSTLRKENEARESMVHRRKTRRGSDKRPSNPEDCIIS